MDIPETAAILLQDFSSAGDELHFHLAGGGAGADGSNATPFSARLVRLFQRPFEENTDAFLPLLPFEILRDYGEILNDQDDKSVLQMIADLTNSVYPVLFRCEEEGVCDIITEATLLTEAAQLLDTAYGDILSKYGID